MPRPPKTINPAEGEHKRSRGRPSKYKQEYCDRVIEWGKLGKSRTWIATELNTSRETLDNWCKVNPEFLDALSRAKQFEQRWWEDKGQEGMTSDKFNQAVWAKNMSCRFPNDWRENSKITVEGDPDKPVHHQHGISWMTEEQAKARGWA